MDDSSVWPLTTEAGLLRLHSKFLKSRVARRIFALFVACALVPVTVLTVLSYLQVSGQLRSQNQRELGQATKSLDMALFERLTILDSDLEIAALQARLSHSGSWSLADTSRFQA